MRILTFLMLAVVVGTGQAWADALSNPRVKFVYSGEQHGTAFASEVDANRVVIITVTPEGDWRCLDGNLTAEVSSSSNMAEAPRRSLQVGQPVTLNFEGTNVFSLTLPEVETLNVTVYVSFSEKLTFSQAPTVSIYDWTYGDDANEPNVTDNESNGDVTYTYADTENGTYSKTVPTRAGTYWVKATVAATADYKECESAPKAFTISQKPITIASMNVNDKVYDGTTTATLSNTFSFEDGLIVGDDDVSIDFSGASAEFADANAGSDKAVTVTGLALSGTDMNNYVLTNSTFTTTANITKKDLIITANDHNIFYGNAAANDGVTYSGFVNGETESVLEEELTYTYSNDKGLYGEGNDAPGDYVITPGGLTSNNYEITFESGELYVCPLIVEVKVVDATNSEEIGKTTTIQVLDGDGNVVIDYNGNDVIATSTGGAFVIDRLKTGVTYTLHETVAPEGYVLPTDLTFTINNEAQVTTTNSDNILNGVLLLKNAKTHVEISVVDVANGEEIEGATIQVIDPDNKVVEEWTSTPDNHVIEGLKTGEEYTLRETVAPEGYVRPTDYTFTIDETGKITSSGTVSENGVLLVENSKTHVEVSVVDIADGEEIAGATIQVIDSESNVFDEWTSTTENHVIEGLKTDEEYTLRESVAPNGYLFYADNTFTIAADGTITYTGTMTEDKVLLVKNSISVDVSVAVFWNDGNNTEGFRPESVIVRLKKGDETIGSKVLTVDNNWSYTFADLYKYDDAGDEITYIVTEDDVENYTTNVVGYTITNQRDIEETEATVKVVWVDGNDELHNRPESVTATLSDNTHTVTLNAVNEWTTTVTGLQKYSNATPIVYTWTQDEDALPEGYVQTNSAVTEAVTTFTDSYYPAVTVTITGHNNETTYDGTEHVVSGYEAVSSYSLYTADDFTFSGMASASQTNVGTKNMGLVASQFVNDNANYDGKVTFVIAENGDGYQTITPASVIVKADDKSKEWGTADDPTLTATVTGMVNDEDASTLIAYTIDRATGTITDGVENSGEYTITPTGDATQGNYAVTYKTGKFTIEGKPVTIQDVEGHDVSSVDDAYTITQDQNGVTLTLVVPDETTTPPTVDIPVAVEVNHVVIDRLFESGKAATVYLPLSIKVSKILGGTFHTFLSVDETATPWTVTYSNPLADDATLQAGTPYIFMPDGSNGGKIVVNNGNEKISICTADQHKDKQGQWEFIGTYNPIVWLSDPNAAGYTPERAAEIGSVYGFAAEEKTFDGKDYTVGQFVKVGSGASIDPNRAYLKRNVDQQAPALGGSGRTAVELPSAMRVVILSANSTTGIVEMRNENEEMRNDTWHTLGGRRLQGKPSGRGMYIHNGRKEVIR